MSRKEQAEKKHRHEHCCEQLPNGQIEFPFQKAINGQAQHAANSVVNRPDCHEIVAGLALIRVTASRASIQRGKPVAKAAHFFPADEYWANPACRASQAQTAAKITPGRGPRGWRFHQSGYDGSFRQQREDYLS